MSLPKRGNGGRGRCPLFWIRPTASSSRSFGTQCLLVGPYPFFSQLLTALIMILLEIVAPKMSSILSPPPRWCIQYIATHQSTVQYLPTGTCRAVSSHIDKVIIIVHRAAKKGPPVHKWSVRICPRSSRAAGCRLQDAGDWVARLQLQAQQQAQCPFGGFFFYFFSFLFFSSFSPFGRRGLHCLSTKSPPPSRASPRCTGTYSTHRLMAPLPPPKR